jgi:serine phosphatase RsbU (regulator of sigma subunit)
MFATIFFGFLNPDSGVMHYINAGHEPPMIIGAEGAKPRLYPTGPAVGLFPNAAFDVLKIKLEPGDVLLAYTDGVVDAQSIAGERFTKYRLKKLVAASVPSATSLIDKISDQIKNHNTGQQQYDDITILALRRNISS